MSVNRTPVENWEKGQRAKSSFAGFKIDGSIAAFAIYEVTRDWQEDCCGTEESCGKDHLAVMLEAIPIRQVTSHSRDLTSERDGLEARLVDPEWDDDTLQDRLKEWAETYRREKEARKAQASAG